MTGRADGSWDGFLETPKGQIGGGEGGGYVRIIKDYRESGLG